MKEVLTGDIRKVWKKYLFAALGSAIISCIYATVDLIIVGQYEGPNGAAAMAVIQPMWSVIMAIGIMFAVGGSVMLGVARGAKDKSGESYFSVTLVASIAASALLVLIFRLFRFPLYRLFGASDELMPLVEAYAGWLSFFLPFFLVGQVLIFFLRNDGAPMLATVAVSSCGVLNIAGDLILVFVCDMGMEGAAIATVLCQTLAVLILCTHFLRKKCTLRFVWPEHFGEALADVLRTGVSPFIVDISVFVSSILFNNRIMRLAGATELAVYGTCSNIVVLTLSLLYGVGGALQPIASASRGARDWKRMTGALRLALGSAFCITILFTAIVELFPAPILRAYMSVTPEVLAVGPRILRIIGTSFVFLSVNITASYYLQSVLRTRESLAVSLLRGIILTCPLLFALPAAFGFDAIWWTMPVTEFITAVAAAGLIKKQIQKDKEI